MSSAEFNFLHIFHVSSVLLLIGATFYAFAAPPETKTKVAMYSGIAALLVLLSGFRMWQVQFGMAMAGWIAVKFVCWLAIASFSALAYRRRDKAALWITLTAVLAIIAITMAYVKPF
ncbi:MAG: hypothetical protein ABSA05_13830 [Opitutaceae bacterium]|jgi:hypothetical protein